MGKNTRKGRREDLKRGEHQINSSMWECVHVYVHLYVLYMYAQ